MDDPPRALAERLHRGHQDLIAHPRAVAQAVPQRFRAVAWLHHAREAGLAANALFAAGLTQAEVRAIELLTDLDLVPREAKRDGPRVREA